MATGGQKENGCSLINVEGVILEHTSKYPLYLGIVVCRNMIFVLDWKMCKVGLHGLQDGKLLYESDRLESSPRGICFINHTEIAVILQDGLIKIMSIDSTSNTLVITWTRNFHVQGGLDRYDGVVSFKDDLVVCGVKQDTVCWCIVSHNDGHVVGTIHQICKVKNYKTLSSFLTTKDDSIYISCNVGVDSLDTGVYAYDVQNPTKYKYRYKHKDLKSPRGIVIDQHGYMFVCNYSFPYDCIHHLTSECQLVSIFTQGIPRDVRDIFWDNGHLYVTCYGSNHITRYRTQYPDPVIPAEILKMDTKSLHMYKDALRAGKEKVYNIRVMVVGQYGVGKTTLTKRLLGKDVLISERKSTEGIDVHVDCSKVSLTTGEWTKQEKNAEQFSRLRRLLKLLNEHGSNQDARGDQVGQSNGDDLSVKEEHGNEHPQRDEPVGAKPYIKKEVKPTSSQPLELSVVKVNQRYGVQYVGQEKTKAIPTEAKSSETDLKKDAVMEILQLVNANAGNLNLEKSTVEYASLAMWDFAGQFVFYTTHQTFLTSRAIYLLVIDLSQQITDTIKDDECFLDAKGKQLCKVYDLLEIWLNSIHSCTPSPQSGIPAVILVGTHVDKIPENSRQKIIEEYFRKIRHMLKDKPTILHLVDDIAIDNTQHDSTLGLEELRKRIFELAKQQPHWGEERPARWLPLEEAIMTLKTSGVKVVNLSLVEEINRSQSVRIDDSKELDMFLRFQHEMGTIIYFSVEGLRENIVLDPQWLIDAQKSLITAERFMKGKPAIIRVWYDFKEKGMLTQELIDAIWTNEENPEFYRNKDHILLLMEKMNIITKPRSYSEDGKELKVENYFLAPCMLQQAMPAEIISPEPHHERENTSVLCYAFKGKYLPSPIFHRLIAACLTHWSIAKRKTQNLIFCGCCVLDIDPCHKLTLYLRDYAIFARVAKVSSKNTTPDLKLCIDVRDFIKENLLKIIGSLCHNLEFELHIQCPESEKDCLDSIFPVSKLQENEELCCSVHSNDHPVVSHDLLKFWFEDEESQEREGEDNAFSLSSDMLDRKPSEQELSRLSLRIGSEFYLLGLHLELSSSTIEQIQRDHQYTVTQCLMILVKWRQDSGDKATFQNLEIAFKDVGIDIDILHAVILSGDIVSCLPQTFLNKQLEERHLVQICDRIGKEYLHLGIELGVPVVKIEQIRMQHSSNVSKQCFEIMREWKEKNATQATFRNLELAMKCSGIEPTILIQCVE